MMNRDQKLKTYRSKRDKLAKSIHELRRKPGLRDWLSNRNQVSATHLGPLRVVHPVAEAQDEDTATLLAMMDAYFGFLEKIASLEPASSDDT